MFRFKNLMTLTTKGFKLFLNGKSKVFFGGTISDLNNGLLNHKYLEKSNHIK